MKVKCFHCHQHLEVEAAQLGGQVPCPHCSQMVTLPKADAGDDGDDEPQSMGSVVGSWLQSSISGLVSLVVHMSLLLILALVTCDYRGGEGLGDEVLIGELPDVELSSNSTEQLDAMDAQTPAEEATQLDEVEVVTPPDESSSEANLDVNLADLAPSGASGAAVGQIGTVGGGGGALGGGVSFMGLHAKGTRFVIIADHSGSMSGAKLQFVKEEILETLTTMRSRGRFQIVFFNSRAAPFPQQGWRHPQKDRPAVEKWLASINAGGGTYPTPAFRVAMAMTPRPDAIFFMTDGQFPAGVVAEVDRLNAQGEKVAINTISFMDRSAEQQMRQIANDSGGKYRHVAGF